MKKLLGLLLIGLSTLYGCEESPVLENTEDQNTVIATPTVTTDETLTLLDNEVIDSSDWGSLSALEETEFTIEEMLIYALQDEFTARAEYIHIMEKFDVTKPFSNIKDSEETHIALLLPLFESYQIEVIDDDSSNHLFEIDTLLEAYEIGVIAEINNIAMYDLFLTQDLPDDLIDAFTKLRDASINHLAAFEKNAEKASS